MKRNILAPTLLSLMQLACPESEPPAGALDPPSIDATMSPTNQNPVTLTGTGRAGATIRMAGGMAPSIATVGQDGRFSLAIQLEPNSINQIAIAQSLDNRTSSPVQVTIVHDDIAPPTPAVDPVATPTPDPTQSIHGTAALEAAIEIEGGAEPAMGSVDATGRFDVLVALRQDAINTLSVFAVDAAGNRSGPAMVTILHDPDVDLAPPNIDPPPAYTNMVALPISGRAQPNLAVRISGGAAAVQVPVSDQGEFFAAVELLPDRENTLSLFVVDVPGGRVSPPATVVVVHDDVAPGAPNVNPVQSPTGATIIRISGTAEASTAIAARLIEDGSMQTAATAASGSFSLNVSLVQNSTNTIEITATDFAMNTSRPFVLTVVQSDALPVPPQVDPVATPTNQNPIAITGLTEVAGEAIEISGGAAPVTVNAAGDRTFAAMVMLSANARNTLVVARVNGGASTSLVVDHDDIAPAAPQVNPVASPTNQASIQVTGTTEPTISVTIRGGAAASSANADAAGQFDVPVALNQDADNTLTIVATDHAQNVSAEVAITVTHSSAVPDAPIVDDPNPAPTNEPIHTVTGRVTMPQPGMQVQIEGGQSSANGPVDPQDGTFAIEVTLAPNAQSTLDVRSFVGGLVSPPAFVSIVHDDIAPAAPDGGLIEVDPAAAPLGVCALRSNVGVIGQAGSVEGSAIVRITNIDGGFGDDYQATPDGSFSGSQLACPGETLSIRAIDAAGNIGQQAEITVRAQ